jgi:hypothetical protein
MSCLALAVVVISLATMAAASAQPVEPAISPKPVKIIPIKPAGTVTLECEKGWTLVIQTAPNQNRPMCARELKEPNRR